MYNKKTVENRRRRIRSVVDCLNEGLTAKEMAEELGVSKRTINKDIQYIRENQNE